MNKEQDKKEIIKKKNKLKDCKIFIENNLIYGGKERYKKWAKQIRIKGDKIKIEFRKVKNNEVWRYLEKQKK